MSRTKYTIEVADQIELSARFVVEAEFLGQAMEKALNLFHLIPDDMKEARPLAYRRHLISEEEVAQEIT